MKENFELGNVVDWLTDSSNESAADHVARAICNRKFNFEVYKDDIMPFVEAGIPWARMEDTGRFLPCDEVPDVDCPNCTFGCNDNACECNKVKWLYEKYKKNE